jgi:hypothetical protein
MGDVDHVGTPSFLCRLDFWGSPSYGAGVLPSVLGPLLARLPRDNPLLVDVLPHFTLNALPIYGQQALDVAGILESGHSRLEVSASMGASTVAGITGWWPLRRFVTRSDPWCVPDVRRILQLSLAAAWLFDGVLQLQPFMFTPAFGSQMIAPVAHGNPGVFAGGIMWSAREIAHHPTLANASFACIQLLIAIGIAWRPTVKAALGVSVIWSLGVWWIGEGLGGVLSGTASPLNGAPGAVILYALLAVLLWPAGPDSRTTGADNFVAARPLGALPARLCWLTLWASLAWFAAQSPNRGSDDLRNMISTMASGEPRWLSSLDLAVARDLAGRGLEVSIAMTVVFCVIALGVFAPARVGRLALVLAVAVAVAIWVVGEGFGGVFSGPATDPNSGPLLVLLAVAYWPLASAGPAPAGGGPVTGPVPSED